MGDVFNVVITTIQSLNRTQMSRTKTCLHRWMYVVCTCVVWPACGTDVFPEGKEVRQFLRYPSTFPSMKNKINDFLT